MLDFLSDLFDIIWAILVNMHLWLILSAIITVLALRDGLIQVAIGCCSIGFLIIFFKWDVILGEYFMTRSMVAVGLGLIVAFFIWQFKD